MNKIKIAKQKRLASGMTESEKHFSEFLKKFTERSRIHHESLKKAIAIREAKSKLTAEERKLLDLE